MCVCVFHCFRWIGTLHTALFCYKIAADGTWQSTNQPTNQGVQKQHLLSEVTVFYFSISSPFFCFYLNFFTASCSLTLRGVFFRVGVSGGRGRYPPHTHTHTTTTKKNKPCYRMHLLFASKQNPDFCCVVTLYLAQISFIHFHKDVMFRQSLCPLFCLSEVSQIMCLRQVIALLLWTANKASTIASGRQIYTLICAVIRMNNCAKSAPNISNQFLCCFLVGMDGAGGEIMPE